MFEKDAEKYGKENCVIWNNGLCTFVDSERTSKIWQDGAEFGYNKALEELGDLRNCCNCKHWRYSTRSLSYYCDKTDKIADYERQFSHCEHWER